MMTMVILLLIIKRKEIKIIMRNLNIHLNLYNFPAIIFVNYCSCNHILSIIGSNFSSSYVHMHALSLLLLLYLDFLVLIMCSYHYIVSVIFILGRQRHPCDTEPRVQDPCSAVPRTGDKE